MLAEELIDSPAALALASASLALAIVALAIAVHRVCRRPAPTKSTSASATFGLEAAAEVTIAVVKPPNDLLEAAVEDGEGAEGVCPRHHRTSGLSGRVANSIARPAVRSGRAYTRRPARPPKGCAARTP